MMRKAYVNLPEGQVHYVTAGQGAPLLLFHQASISADEWREVIPLLSDSFTVFAPDMLGHGSSDDSDSEQEMEDFAATALRFMDALGIKKATCCGNHSGAALATALAVIAPERVSKLIVSCEMLLSAEQLNTCMARLLEKPLSRELPMDEAGQFLVEAWDRYKALAPTAVAAQRFRPFIIGQASRLRPYDAHFAVLRWMAQADWLAGVGCPILVVGAEHDLFFNRGMHDEVLRRFAQGSFEVIRNAGALSTFEQPVAWAQAILAFARA